MKKYDSYKECSVITPNEIFKQSFTNDWKYSAIENWMLDTYSIDKDSIVEIRLTNVTIYKTTI